MLPPKYWLVQHLDIRQDSVPLYTLITLILRQCFVTSCPYKECNLASSTALSSSLKYQGDRGGSNKKDHSKALWYLEGKIIYKPKALNGKLILWNGCELLIALILQINTPSCISTYLSTH